MSRDTGGTYHLTPGVNPVVPDTIIATAWANPTLQDIAAALTDSLSRSGVGSMLANLSMNNFRLTNVGNATQPTDAPNALQIRDFKFNWLSPVSSDATGNIYTGTALLQAPVVAGTMYVFQPDKTNTGAVTMNVNGAGPVAILANGANLSPGALTVGRIVVMVYAGTAFNITTGANLGVNSLVSADSQMLAVSQTTPGAVTLTPVANVPGGMVKLTSDGYVPANLLALQGLVLKGFWDASSGALPGNGTISGQYYIINPGGTLNLYVSNGVGGWVSQPTLTKAGDFIVWYMSGPQPIGWYWNPQSTTVTAGGVALTPTPSFPSATNVQAWANAADAVTGFLLANGTRPGGTSVPQQFGNLTLPDTGFIGRNLIYNSGWKYISASGFGVVEVIGGGVFTQYMTTAASSGAGSVATIVPMVNINQGASYELRVPVSIGGAFRSAAAANLDVHSASGARLTLGYDNASGSTLFTAVNSSGVTIQNFRTDAAGNILFAGGLPMVFQQQRTDGYFAEPILTLNPNGMVQVGVGVGVSSNTGYLGSLVSTYKYLGSYSGALDMRAAQTYGCAVGSSFSSITMAGGQVARILVVGNGAVTLPAATHWAVGSPTWGTVATIINMFSHDGTNIYAATTPFNT